MYGLDTLAGKQYPAAGTVVSVPIIFGYRHKGIVSDRWSCGKPMVISGSARQGTVCEEPWNDFAGGRPVRGDGYASTLPLYEVLNRARALIGTRYHLFDLNCDHVVAIAHGQKAESPQVHATVAIALVALAVSAMANAG